MAVGVEAVIPKLDAPDLAKPVAYELPNPVPVPKNAELPNCGYGVVFP